MRSAGPRRLVGLAFLLALLAAASVLSLAVGARALTPAEVWQGLFGDPGNDQRLTEITLIVQTLRVPRTVLAIVAGLALGVAGALIQGHTRNPIADTGLLGVNSGASFAVVLAVYLFGLGRTRSSTCGSPSSGAAAAGVLVFGLSSLGRGAGNPLTLALAGQGVTIFLASMTTRRGAVRQGERWTCCGSGTPGRCRASASTSSGGRGVRRGRPRPGDDQPADDQPAQPR